MTDDELMELARQAGWSGCDPAMRAKLIQFGKLVVKRKNEKHRHQTDSGKPLTKEENATQGTSGIVNSFARQCLICSRITHDPNASTCFSCGSEWLEQQAVAE